MPSMLRTFPAPVTDSGAQRPVRRAAIGAIVIGASLVFLAGFVQVAPIHDGAHDARHGAALPCH